MIVCQEPHGRMVMNATIEDKRAKIEVLEQDKYGTSMITFQYNVRTRVLQLECHRVITTWSQSP